ncbi:MAG: ABC transporter ATP-binding protein, partial [Clostridiales bacterium]|nr:ABC transporter ATP-binding protein [Clostridiales bacterium]
KIGNFILLYYVGNQILKDNMTLGQLTMFTSYVSLVYGPIRWMANVPRMIQHFSTATAKVFEVMDEDPDVADRPGAVDLKIRGQVDVKNVYFGYNENENVLENVSVSVGPGEMLGIVGRSGVGKSTPSTPSGCSIPTRPRHIPGGHIRPSQETGTSAGGSTISSSRKVSDPR